MNENFSGLRSRLASRSRRVMTAQRRAAVLVPLIVTPDSVDLLLTRRAEHLSSHRGQVAFPGGGVEPGDENLVQTALREAREEVSLMPELVEVLGLLDDLPTVTEDTIVTPVVGVVHERSTLKADPNEVARIFSIPLDYLVEPTHWRTETHIHRNRSYPLYFLDYDGETLWGLSAYITRQLLDFMGAMIQSQPD
ncbi:MAG: CoA pyrophosphatase [Bradymonadia bacterium]